MSELSVMVSAEEIYDNDLQEISVTLSVEEFAEIVQTKDWGWYK